MVNQEGEEIAAKIREIRDKSGLSLDTVAERCAPKWGTKMTTARLYISGNIVDSYGWNYISLTSSNYKHVREKCKEKLIERTKIYVEAIGASDFDKKELYDKLSRFYSEVKPLTFSDSLNSMEGLNG